MISIPITLSIKVIIICQESLAEESASVSDISEEKSSTLINLSTIWTTAICFTESSTVHFRELTLNLQSTKLQVHFIGKRKKKIAKLSVINLRANSRVAD